MRKFLTQLLTNLARQAIWHNITHICHVVLTKFTLVFVAVVDVFREAKVHGQKSFRTRNVKLQFVMKTS